MSRELRNKADIMIKELRDALVPLSDEIIKRKTVSDISVKDDYYTG